MPPMATAGNPVATANRENSFTPIASPASRFDMVLNTGPIPT